MLELTVAQTFEAWATGVAAIATAVAVVIGGGWVFWRYILPAPLAPTWQIVVPDCTARRLRSGRFEYYAQVNMMNTSVTSYIVDSLAVSIFQVGEASLQELEAEDDEVSDAAWARLPRMKPSELGRVFPPQNMQSAFQRIIGDWTLHHIVVVCAEIRFRRRKYLGTFGWRTHAFKIVHRAPVGAESLALYTESSTEEESDD